MSEKRFSAAYENYGAWDEVLCKKLSYDEVVELLNELNDENERLRQQLLYDCDDVCGICRHKYLVPSGDYFIGKCEKGHEECSKEDIKYCEDFELRGVYDDCQIR